VQEGDTHESLSSRFGTFRGLVVGAYGPPASGQFQPGDAVCIPSHTPPPVSGPFDLWATPLPGEPECDFQARLVDTLIQVCDMPGSIGFTIGEIIASHPDCQPQICAAVARDPGCLAQFRESPNAWAGEVPACRMTPEPTPTATPCIQGTYIVQEGDFILLIAEKFGITPEELMEASGITDPAILTVGQELIVPCSTRSPTPTASPTPPPLYPDPAPQRLFPCVYDEETQGCQGVPEDERPPIPSPVAEPPSLLWQTMRDGQFTYCVKGSLGLGGYLWEAIGSLVGKYWGVRAVPILVESGQGPVETCDGVDLVVKVYMGHPAYCGWSMPTGGVCEIGVNEWCTVGPFVRDNGLNVESVVEKTLLHEIGHCFGFGHRNDYEGAMFIPPVYWPNGEDRWALRELYQLIPEPTPWLTPTPTATPCIQGTYIVQEGDYIAFIAEKFGITPEEVMEANGITDPASLSIGQALVIPCSTR